MARRVEPAAVPGGVATWLDRHMLQNRRIKVYEWFVSDDELPLKTGRKVSKELGGRLLVRYLLAEQAGGSVNGTRQRTWLTPTGLCANAVSGVLKLFVPHRPRTLAMFIDPAKLPDNLAIRGPRYVEGGLTIEYVLEAGFPASAVVGDSPEMLVG